MYDSETSLLKNGTPLKFCDKQTEKEILWTQMVPQELDTDIYRERFFK